MACNNIKALRPTAIVTLIGVIVSPEAFNVLLSSAYASRTTAFDIGSAVFSLPPYVFALYSIGNALLAAVCSRPYFRIDENKFSSIRFLKSVYTKISYDRDENFEPIGVS